MNTPPLSQNFDIRLERLNREIRQGLDEVRRRIHELERVEESTRPGAAEKFLVQTSARCCARGWSSPRVPRLNKRIIPPTG